MGVGRAENGQKWIKEVCETIWAVSQLRPREYLGFHLYVFGKTEQCVGHWAMVFGLEVT